jgi:hypothetical protein
MENTNHTKWIALAHAMSQLGYDIIGGASDFTKGPGTKGSALQKVTAIMLLSRTLSNLKGIITLLDKGLVVEARILARCCFENAFWIAGLLTQGDEFVEQMRQDDVRSSRSRSELLLTTYRERIPEEIEIQLRKQLRSIKEQWPQPKSLSPKDVAWSGLLRDGYHIYSQLSADAAHPSLTALRRHYDPDGPVQHDEIGKTVIVGIDVVPAPDEEEVTTTWEWACHAVLGACAGVNEILGGTPAGEQLEEITARYQALTTEVA